MRSPGHPGPPHGVCSVPMEPMSTPPTSSPALRRGRNGLVFAVGLLAASCLTEFPERLADTGDAMRSTGDATGVVPGADAVGPLDGAPTPDAFFPPTAPPVPDAAPPAPVPDTGVPATEQCNGDDDDGDGLVDEDGDADCLKRFTDRPICDDGRCKTCIPETNEGCLSTHTCRGDDAANVCTQCLPEENYCPAEQPYCSPMLLVCAECPELAPYGRNESAQRCHDGPFDGHCEFLFQPQAGTVNSCLDLCRAVGMRCARAFMVDPEAAGETDDGPICRPDLQAECESPRQGDLICDCAQ